jgi:hypothetical protein
MVIRGELVLGITRSFFMLTRLLKLSLVFLVTNGLLPLIAKADAKYNWYRYDVDSAKGEEKGKGQGALFGFSSIKHDASGNVKLGFRGHYDLKYAELQNHLWKIVVADTGLGGADAKMDMDLDAAGNPHFFFQTPGYDRVIYVHKKGSTWEEKEINKLHIQNLDFYNLSIKVDADSNVHMLYSSEHANYPYATYSKYGKDGVLASPVILRPNGGIAGKWNSIALDSKNSPLFSYYIQAESNLALSYMGSDTLKSQLIDSAGYENAHGYFNTLQRENDTSYYLSYLNTAKHIIQVAHGQPGGKWTVQKVDTMPAYTLFSSVIRMVLDSKGSPILAYPVVNKTLDGAITESALRIAYKKDSVWAYETIDSVGSPGQYVSMSILANDMPIISYWEGTKKTLKVVVASLTAPPDSNSNGIPDYKEVVSIFRNHAFASPMSRLPLPAYDILGRGKRQTGSLFRRDGQYFLLAR